MDSQQEERASATRELFAKLCICDFPPRTFPFVTIPDVPLNEKEKDLLDLAHCPDCKRFQVNPQGTLQRFVQEGSVENIRKFARIFDRVEIVKKKDWNRYLWPALAVLAGIGIILTLTL